ncbi:MAG: hypothetical protein ACD_62C00527G0004 [uncultured bacterium]|nr:MAG: hypothetical protein ACD_62C00527G0004 [uncultured bacterium]HLD45165.1 tryptophanase [bacterium]
MTQEEYPFEPYLISVTRPINITTREERQKIIRDHHFNLFKIPSKKVMIDLLTDSGTGAISNVQLAGIILGDESYAGSSSFDKMLSAIEDITGFKYVIPTHQGRGAENVLHSTLIKEGDLIPGNTHFDTTKAHIEYRKGIAIDCTIDEAKDPLLQHPFKGNIDLDKLEKVLKGTPKNKIPFVLITVTCNSGGGQPVSMANIQAVKALCHKQGLRVFFDMARYAENAYFIKTREPAYHDWTIRDIIKEMFKGSDGATMSAKKDAIVAMGGFLALRDEGLYQQCSVYSILFEGYLTYGGMTGGTMETIAAGMYEGTEYHYLKARVGQVARLAQRMKDLGVPVVEPAGGHAVYVNAGKMIPHITADNYPAQALGVAAYVHGGVRGVEIGTVLADRDPITRQERHPHLELLRLAIPRRTLTDNHMNYVAETFHKVSQLKDSIRGLKIIREAPILRHFTCEFDEI